jgi:drug/metabolite transporter (DMT)-like permease
MLLTWWRSLAPTDAAAAIPVSATEQRRTRVWIALLAVYLIWGTTYLALKLALATFPPFMLAAVRQLVAGGALYLFLRARGAPAPTPGQWAGAAAVSLFLLMISNVAVTWSQQFVSSSLAAIVVSSMPIFAAGFSAAFGQRPSKAELAGLVVGFAGVIALNWGGELRGHGAGAWVLLLAPVCWAFGSIWSKRLTLPPALMSTAAQMLLAFIVVGAVSVASGERIKTVPGAFDWAVLGYLTVAGSLIGLSAYNYLLRNARPAVATSYAYVNPLIAVLLGVGLAGESLRPTTVIAGAIILTGVVLLRRR